MSGPENPYGFPPLEGDPNASNDPANTQWSPGGQAPNSGSLYPDYTPGGGYPPSGYPQNAPTYPGMSTPMSQPPYPQGAPPSQPFYPQGAPPSQPLYPQGGPMSQPFYPGGPQTGPFYPGGAPVATMAPPALAKKSRKGLWITLGVVAALLVVGGGGAALGITRYKAAGDAATTFCSDLRTQNYAAAYQLLSAKQQGLYKQADYTQGSTLLDTLEGQVISCGEASGGNAYNYSFGANTATVSAVITRAKTGNLQGVVHLVNESGGWKVDALDTSLLGVNLGALQTAGAFCQALQTQDYTTAFGLLDSKSQGSASASDFATGAKLQDAVDGKITACGLVGLGSTNNDSAANLQASVTRAKLGQRQGALSLTFEGGAWKVSNLDQKVQGTDLSALVVAIRWCGDIAKANYKDAFSISTGQFAPTLAQFEELFNGTTLSIPGGTDTVSEKWTSCQVDPSTYTLNGTNATVNAVVHLIVVFNGQTQQGDLTYPLKFEQVSGNWKWFDLGPAAQSGASAKSAQLATYRR